MELNEIQKNYITEKLNNLEKSKFRSSFKLRKKELEYLNSKGLELIESHCHDFIENRLAPYPTPNDGKQTPMKGHPVFIAQHATATCCRGCLNKWYKIPKTRPLTAKEKRFIEALIIEWIKKESNKK
jgi:hypothetical protein